MESYDYEDSNTYTANADSSQAEEAAAAGEILQQK